MDCGGGGVWWRSARTQREPRTSAGGAGFEGCSDCDLISIDTLRPDRLGCYGNPQPTSPNIDGFAGESVLFAVAIAQAPSTLPSHATMLLPYFLQDRHVQGISIL